MVAKVQALFDKGDVEKQHSLETNNIEKDSEAAIQKNAEVIKAALIDQLATGKVGSLTVDPQYLDFEALECKCDLISIERDGTLTKYDFQPTDKSATDKSAKETLLSFFDLSETRLYIVLGLIAALVLIALIQACCTIMKTSRKNKNTKVSL